METRIAVSGVDELVRSGSGNRPVEEAVSEALAALDTCRKEFAATTHSPNDIQAVSKMLTSLEKNLEAPLRLHSKPGEAMEVADSAAAPLLNKAKGLGDTDLVDSIWQSVMSFNDYLITSDPTERNRFDEGLKTLESHPKRTEFANELEQFKKAGVAVFDAQSAKNGAVAAYTQQSTELHRYLDDVESRFESQVVTVTAADMAKTIASVKYGTAVMIGAVFALSVVIGLVTAWFVVRPLRTTIDRLRDIAEGEGDLTKELDDRRADELGEMAHWFNAFVQRIRTIISDLASDSRTLASSSTELSANATQLASGADEMTSQSNTVSAAADQMTTSIANMAAAAEQMSANVKSVATATSQMTTSITEIAGNAERASTVANSAANLAEASNVTVSKLGTAANEIGKVIEVIQDLSEQTNLLALNATIEAARAGEAGKGFAVVATEVKELARQTAGATDDIRNRVEGIQSSTSEAIRSIEGIKQIIEQVKETSRTIAAAVEEQSITSREIARGVSDTSNAVDMVAAGVNESAATSQEITRNISQVHVACRQTAEGAGQTRTAGQELSQVAERLQALVSQFKV
jgi:methyl-accepting chemotaxis protein